MQRDPIIKREQLSGHGQVRHIKRFDNPKEALEYIVEIYEKNTAYIRQTFLEINEGTITEPPQLENATYPYVGIQVTHKELNVDGSVVYGAALEPGIYGTTLTHPDVFYDYYLHQLALLIKHHNTSIIVGESDSQIPLPFVDELDSINFNPENNSHSTNIFALPSLTVVNDDIPNGTFKVTSDEPLPLALFTAERVDYSLGRLHHYCGASARHFQRFILLTNYQRYIDEFIQFGKQQVADSSSYHEFVEPGEYITYNPRFNEQKFTGHKPDYLPQMPAYHLKRPDGNGITFINIGVGPSNAKTITDHLAVLRPHCWIMLGHCAGLRRSQILGDYVLAHAYIREDHVLDADLPEWVPIPAIAEIQVALQQAVANVTKTEDLELKKRMRTGTVVTTDNRNWELRSSELMERFRQSRAIGLDMESATIAANGFRLRVPYGTLLCVSDKPIHGELKLRGMANTFYRERVNQHFLVGIETIRLLQEQLDNNENRLHSRKLRAFDEAPFR